MRYSTISHTPAPHICHLHLETFHVLMPIISKTSGQFRVFFWLVCLFVRILEQKLLSSGMHLMQCNFTYLCSFLNSLHTQAATRSEAVRPTGSLPSCAPGLPSVPCHLRALLSRSYVFCWLFPPLCSEDPQHGDKPWGCPGTTSAPEHCLGALHWISKVQLRCSLLS